MATKKSDRQKVFTKARYSFSPGELRDVTLELTQAMKTAGEREESAKAAAAVARAEIKSLRSKINELANKVTSGGEDRDVEATVEFLPRKSVKVFRYHCPGRPEHDTEIRREPMTPSDYEGTLPLEDTTAPPKPEDKPPGETGA